MITTLKNFETDIVSGEIPPDQLDNGFFFDRKMLILESNWDSESVYNKISVYPFLSNISSFTGEQVSVQVGYRNFDSIRGLKFYTQYPDGMIWNDPLCYGTSVFFISTHGNPKSLLPTLDIIRSETMFDSLTGFENYPNIILFGSCSLFEGKQGENFGYDLLGSTKSRGIFGWKSKVSLIDSIVTSQIFLNRFFSLNTGNPFEQLPEVYESVLEDYKPSRDSGFSMYI